MPPTFINPPAQVIVEVGVQGAGTASAGTFSLFPGTNLVNATNVAASVVISSATLNAAAACAWSQAGGGALT